MTSNNILEKLSDLTKEYHMSQAKCIENYTDKILKELHEYLDRNKPSLNDIKTAAKSGKNKYIVYSFSEPVNPYHWDCEANVVIKDRHTNSIYLPSGKYTVTKGGPTLCVTEKTISSKYIYDYLASSVVDGLGKPKKTWFSHKLYYKW